MPTAHFGQSLVNIRHMIQHHIDIWGAWNYRVSLNDVPEHTIKEILMRNVTDGILNIPKEYGMFVAS